MHVIKNYDDKYDSYLLITAKIVIIMILTIVKIIRIIKISRKERKEERGGE